MKTSKLFLFLVFSLFITSVKAADVVNVTGTGGSVTTSNITQWYNCVAKGTQLIDMARNGSYITFDLTTSVTGYYTFTSAIGTTLTGISGVLGYTNPDGTYIKADTLAVKNNGSWSSTVNYDWLFYLEAGTTYKFKMTCIAGSGYAFNAYSINITPFVANVTAKSVKVNGFDMIVRSNAYSTFSNFDSDITVAVTPTVTSATVSYKAKCNGSDIAISTSGVINKSLLKNGDVVIITATIKHGSVATADYNIEIEVNDLLKKQLLGSTTNDGYWNNSGASSSLKNWTDYIYTMTPAITSTTFTNSTWTPTGGSQIYCFSANAANFNLAIPTNMQVAKVSVIGYGASTFSLKSGLAVISALTDTTFITSANANTNGEIKYNLTNHIAGTPLNITTGAGNSSFYVVLGYRLVADVDAPILVNQNIQNNDVLQGINGIVSLRFNEAVKISNTATATLNGQTVDLTSENNVFVNHYYCGLNYQSTNKFALKANSVEDMAGNKNVNDIEITFNVGGKPVVTKKLFNFIVGKDGTADQAFAAANAASGTDRYYIFIPNGNYELTGNGGDHVTSLNRANVSIIGQSKDSVILSNTPASYGISTTSTIRINAKNTYIEDLTLKNNKGEAGGGQQVVIYDNSSQSIFKNIKVFSFQDTYVSGDRTYWDNCDIYGSTDYICGGGDVYFDRCLLYNRAASGSKITAPATATTLKFGYVFQNCTIQGGRYVLGRPWQGEPRAYFLNTTMNIAPDGTGWEGMGGLITHFYEYNSKDEAGNLLNLSTRGNSSSSLNTYTPILSENESKNFSLYKVLGRTDGWMPSDFTKQTKVQEVTVNGDIISWTNDNDALCTVIFKNGKYLTCTTQNSYTVTENGIYTLQSANEMGGLGEALTLTITLTGIKDIKINNMTQGAVFDIFGRKLNQIPHSGVFIMNGAKYYIKPSN